MGDDVNIYVIFRKDETKCAHIWKDPCNSVNQYFPNNQYLM